MPRGIKKIKTEDVSTEEKPVEQPEFVTKEEFAQAIKEIKDAIKEVMDRPIADTTTVQVPLSSVTEQGTQTTPTTINVVEPTGNKVPLPFEYQLMLKQILNQKFDAEIELSSDPTQFNFAVIVPKEYSNMGAEYGNTIDRRSKMISRLMAQAGVKEWLQKIYDNLLIETRTRITNERLM